MARRVLLVVLLASLLLTGVQVAYGYDSTVEEMLVLEEIVDRLNQYHLQKPELDELVNGAIEGMLQTVDDPYTEYFSAEELDNFANSLDGDLHGIGVEIRPGDHYPSVTRVISFSPAEKAGIKAGDEIIKVDDVDLKGMDLNTVVEQIRGALYSKVKITVDRKGKGQINFTIVRGRINLPTVDYSLLEGKTGYIFVGSFGSETAEEFKHILNELLSKGITSLVLDLRNNGGGYLQAAVDMVAQFVPPNSTVVSIAGNQGNRDVYVTSESPIAKEIPVVIIVNENSASAAEVMAGALRDHGRAKLVGVQTYGKGVLQTVIPLSNGGALKVTTHRYYTPSGESLDAIGLIPDRQVNVPELQLAAAWQELNDRNYELEFKVREGIAMVQEIEVQYPYMPISESGHRFLPLRFTLEAMGYQVQSLDGSIKISGYGDNLEIYPGSYKVSLNDTEKHLERPVLMRQGISYVSLQVLELLHLNISAGLNSVNVRLLRPEQG